MYEDANYANIVIPRTWCCLIGYESRALSLSPPAPEKRHGHYHGLSVFVWDLHDLWNYHRISDFRAGELSA